MVSRNNIQTLHVWDTEYSADSVEWCPIAPFQNVFVCGTYQLAQIENMELNKRDCDGSSVKQERSEDSTVSNPCDRLGRLYLFAIDSSKGLCLLQTLEMPAILDCKWCHCKLYGKILLAIANAVGDLLVYEMQTDETVLEEDSVKNVKENEPYFTCSLSLLYSCTIAQDVNNETLALSLDWSTGRCKFEDVQNSPFITVSDSKGNISLLMMSDLMLEKRDCWKAHGFEAWITAFDYWNSSVVYTGSNRKSFHLIYSSDVACLSTIGNMCVSSELVSAPDNILLLLSTGCYTWCILLYLVYLIYFLLHYL
jgi:diphthamide biosynthesis protein 7